LDTSSEFSIISRGTSMAIPVSITFNTVYRTGNCTCICISWTGSAFCNITLFTKSSAQKVLIFTSSTYSCSSTSTTSLITFFANIRIKIITRSTSRTCTRNTTRALGTTISDLITWAGQRSSSFYPRLFKKSIDI